MIKYCIICGEEFNAIQSDHIMCSPKCRKQLRKQYMKDYWKKNPDKYINTSKKALRTYIESKKFKDGLYIYNINPHQLKHLCDECLYEFAYNYTVTKTYEHGSISYSTSDYNTTEWGAPICPRCGLVGWSPYYDIEKLPNPLRIATAEEYREIRQELRKVSKPTTIKKLAQYLDDKQTRIDFIEEATQIRRMRNYVNNIGELKKEEIDQCIRAMVSE